MDRYHIGQLESCHNRQPDYPCLVENGFGEPYNGKCQYKEKTYAPVRELMPLCGEDFFWKIGFEYSKITNIEGTASHCINTMQKVPKYM